MNWKRAIAIAAAGAGSAALLIWAFAPRPVDVETATITRGPFLQTVDEDGKTRVRDRYVISAPLAGTLTRITLDEGDAVAKGGVVATISPAVPALLDLRTERELTARLQEAEAQELGAAANVRRAEAALDLARAEARRIEDIAKKGFASAAERDASTLTLRARENEFDAARESRHAAIHALDAARAALSKAMEGAAGAGGKPWQVRAPVAGVVLRVLQKSEAAVTTGAPLLEIGDASDLEVVVDVLSADAVSIVPGNRVLFERWGGDRPVEGRVRYVERSAYTKISALGVEEQRVNVIIDVASSDQKWKAVGDGFRVEARIVIDERDHVLRVPVSALFRAGEHWHVFTVSAGRAREREVTIGPRNALTAVVENGLAEGEAVVIYPSSRVSDGVRVAVR